MKQGIHPEYYECTVKCTCGNTFVTHSTKKELRVDICNACHPFYTGQQKLIDTGGRVQRFTDKFGGAKEMIAQREAAAKAAKKEENSKLQAEKAEARKTKADEKAKRTAEYEQKAAKLAEEAAEESVTVDPKEAAELSEELL